MDSRQDTISKRKQLLRSDAVVGDDDNKLKSANQQLDSLKKHSSSASHSKDSYTDSTGVDILNFVEKTLHKNAKDREFLLGIEDELRKFVADESKSYFMFPNMSSYNRMLVHRVAAFFGLLHNVDQSGQRIVVTRHSGTRMPNIVFRSLIKHSNYHDKYLGRRNVQSFDEAHLSTGRQFPSLRDFRSRFYTSTGEEGDSRGSELGRPGRRTRSFEVADWYNGAGLQQPPPAPYALMMGRQQSLNLDVAGERVNSNCSSSASSSVLPQQMQGLQLAMLQPGQFVQYASTEASMVSPSSASAYSEPILPHSAVFPTVKSQQQQYEEERSDEPAKRGSPSPDQQLQSAHPHIPSLFSIQPFYPMAAAQTYYPTSGFQTPTVISPPPSVLAQASSYYAPTVPAIYFPNPYYPTMPAYAYQQFPQPLYTQPDIQQIVGQFGEIALSSSSMVAAKSPENGQMAAESGDHPEEQRMSSVAEQHQPTAKQEAQ